MIYFPEYTFYNSAGSEVVPYVKNRKWHIGSRDSPFSEQISLTTLGILCKIDEEELTMLKLTYGG
jgi:hypothetical protein